MTKTNEERLDELEIRASNLTPQPISPVTLIPANKSVMPELIAGAVITIVGVVVGALVSIPMSNKK